MALGDVGLKGTWKNNKVYVKKRDVKKAEKALKGNVIYKGKPPVVVGEEVELEENPYMIKVTKDFKYDGKVVTISKKDFKQVHKDFKNSTRGKERMLINDPKTGGSISVPVQFEEVEIEEAKKPTRDAGMECMECGKKFRAKLSTLQYGRTKCPKCKSTDLDFAYGESVEEEVELVEKGVAYPSTIDNLRMIVKDKQHQTFMFKSGKAMVDLFTASAMVQVYDALKKPEMKKTFEKMIKDKAGFMKTQAFAMKMVGK
jgi:phage FluMu protein Com